MTTEKYTSEDSNRLRQLIASTRNTRNNLIKKFKASTQPEESKILALMIKEKERLYKERLEELCEIQRKRYEIKLDKLKEKHLGLLEPFEV